MPVKLTHSVKILLGLTVFFFVLQQSADRWLLDGAPIGRFLSLIPSQAISHFHIWQLFSYSLIHADVTHLLLNCLMLVFLGSELESLWGTKKFVTYWVFCVVISATLYVILNLAASLALESWTGILTPMMGASSGIFGLLLAYGILFSERTMLFMMIFPMKARHFVWVLGGVELFTSLFSGRTSALSAISHLSGMVAGFGILVFWAKLRRSRTSTQTKSRSARTSPNRSHLRLVNPTRDKTISSSGDDEDGSPPPATWH